eukprot:6198046-Pleurochrysis_carterae.AAC.3
MHVEATELPSHLPNASKHVIKVYLVDMAVKLYRDNGGKVSICGAVASVDRKYEHLPEVPQIYASSVHTRSTIQAGPRVEGA